MGIIISIRPFLLFFYFYFKILILPIIGKGFCSLFAAFTIPIIIKGIAPKSESKTKIKKIVERMYICSKLKIIRKMPKPTANISQDKKRTRPWLQWNRTLGFFGSAAIPTIKSGPM